MIEVKEVSFAYNSNQVGGWGLKDVNFRVSRGEFVAIIGRNGSGKSTLAKLLNGLLLPTAGNVLVLGADTKEEDSWEIQRSVGEVFQNPDNQFVAGTVEEDVAFALENLAVPCEEMHKRVERALNQVRMAEYRNMPPELLSGGQKQRVAIAGAIAMGSAFLVLDEATSMLDPQGSAEVINLLKHLKTELNVGVVFITQSMEEAAQADRIIVIDAGQVVLNGAPKDVFRNAEFLNDIGLGLPQTCQLALQLKKAGVELDTTVFSPQDCALEIDRLLNLVLPPADKNLA